MCECHIVGECHTVGVVTTVPFWGLPGDAPLPAEQVSAVGKAIQEALRAMQQGMVEMRDRHRRIDDEMGRLIDQVTADVTAASESIRLKQEQGQRNEARLRTLQQQVQQKTLKYSSPEQTLNLKAMMPI